MKRCALIAITICSTGALASAQTQVDVKRPEERAQEVKAVEKQQKTKANEANIEFRGNTVFKEGDLRTALKEQFATIHDFGLTPARGDDAAFFLELFYRKHGYAKVDVHYQIEGSRLVLDVKEGPQATLGTITFAGNKQITADTLFEFAVGPTRERYSSLQKTLPFVASDVQQGADLVHRYYVSEGFLDSQVETARYDFSSDGARVDVTIPLKEGRQYFFGDIVFRGKTIYGAELLRGQMLDLLQQPYTDHRADDISRRLQAYFKARGYYAVNIVSAGDPARANGGRVPVTITVSPGPLYHFGDVNIKGLQRLRPSYVRNRFTSLEGKTYSPDVLDEKFRELMRTGLFNVLQINPVPDGGETLRLEISAEEAKAKEFGISVGYGSYEGPIAGVQYADRNLFGFGRPLTTSVEVSGRSYKFEILYEDPHLLSSDVYLRARATALTFDYDGYSKFDIGARLELSHKFGKHYEAGVFGSGRHVEVISAAIEPELLGRTSYLVNTIGFFHTLDLRDSPVVPSRGLYFNQTLDVATDVLGSEVNYFRTTARASYFIPVTKTTMLEIGARGGLVRPLSGSSTDPMLLPIDERFFIGGSTTVRSFGERDLGPHDRRGYPVGGEFYTIFNVEYTFPIYGDLLGAVFTDAGNLLPDSDNPGFNDMRYAVGVGLRYKLPIGPIRLDYGVNPNPRPAEDRGAFHFSFGFAF